jgi:hypothetical protein
METLEALYVFTQGVKDESAEHLESRSGRYNGTSYPQATPSSAMT